MSRFEHALSLLKSHSDSTDPSLRRELAEAQRCLEMCARLGFDGRERAYVLPVPETVSPTSELRIMQDNETEHRQPWAEVTFDGTIVRPRAHWVLIAPQGR